MRITRGAKTWFGGRARPFALAVVTAALLLASASPDQAQSLAPPSGGVILGPSSTANPGMVPPGSSIVAPQVPMHTQPVQPAQIAPSPSGQVALYLSARFAGDLPVITSGLQWRIFPDRPDPTGAFRVIKEEKTAAPAFLLPPGGYLVHATFGQASVAKQIQLRSETVREVFDIPAGGLRLEGRVGDARIPPTQISFDIYKGSQFEPGDKRMMTKGAATGDVVLLPEGTYTIVSNYGDSNAVVRSDIRVQAGRLTDVTVTHRAAVITLKLVAKEGGEALANTEWSVLTTPGGDVVREQMIGAFPRIVLAEGEYRAIARNDGKVYERQFSVVTGVDSEVSVVAR